MLTIKNSHHRPSGVTLGHGHKAKLMNNNYSNKMLVSLLAGDLNVCRHKLPGWREPKLAKVVKETELDHRHVGAASEVRRGQDSIY